MAIEFECVDCGHHVVQIIGDTPPLGPFCAQCLVLPGWWKDPVLRRMFDPNDTARRILFPQDRHNRGWRRT